MDIDILIMSRILTLIPQKPELKQRLKSKHFIEVCDLGGRGTEEEGREKREKHFQFNHSYGQLVFHSMLSPKQVYGICLKTIHLEKMDKYLSIFSQTLFFKRFLHCVNFLHS